jgi:hypothetical protein
MAERKGHPPLKFNQELADTFGINPGQDTPRELVKVDHIPVPPDVEHPEAPPRGKRKQAVVPDNPEDRVAVILKEEMEELAVRLSRFGVPFSPANQQSLIDYAMAVLSGGIGTGGAIARRQ